jgi:hypothetical protein
VGEYRLLKSPEFRVQLKTSGIEKKYVDGTWLESYIRHEIERVVKPYAKKGKQQFEIWSNVEITFNGGAKTELDELFAVGEKVYCVEAKATHKPNEDELKEKMGKYKKLLGLDKQVLLVVAAEKEWWNLHEVSGVKIVELDNLEQTLLDLVKTK